MDSRLTTLATAKFAVIDLTTVAGKQAGRRPPRAPETAAPQSTAESKSADIEALILSTLHRDGIIADTFGVLYG